MTVSGSSFNTAFAMMQQTQQTQRSSTPSASEIASDIMEISDLDSDSLLSIDEVNLSDETFSNMDEDGDGSLSSEELETSFSALLESMGNQSTSPEEFGDLLANMGIDVPPPPSSEAGASGGQGSGGGAGESNSSNETYDAADLNEDGTVTSSEQAQYDATTGTISNDDMSDYTMNLVNSFMDAVKNESGSSEEIELSQFKSIMTMVNNEIQDSSTAQKLNTYVSNLDLGLQSA